ncbi:MAG: 5-(carboxyamino)imidazole ribonucleotide synthase, partial [Hyphomicrobiales bacterium]|nr:5-(carboxyamino)imidazole ribonucleotide synthase [Hyphomicrobiales bacterium]
AEMENLLGEEVNDWETHANEPGVYATLYGKGEARPGRKMGHVVRVSPLSR